MERALAKCKPRRQRQKRTGGIRILTPKVPKDPAGGAKPTGGGKGGDGGDSDGTVEAYSDNDDSGASADDPDDDGEWLPAFMRGPRDVHLGKTWGPFKLAKVQKTLRDGSKVQIGWGATCDKHHDADAAKVPCVTVLVLCCCPKHSLTICGVSEFP